MKTVYQDAPKRPKSGYMIFADGIRESVLEKVRADGRGLEEAGRIIKKRWAEFSEAKKRDYDEKSQKMKIACDKDFAVYKKMNLVPSYLFRKTSLF